MSGDAMPRAATSTWSPWPWASTPVGTLPACAGTGDRSRPAPLRRRDRARAHLKSSTIPTRALAGHPRAPAEAADAALDASLAPRSRARDLGLLSTLVVMVADPGVRLVARAHALGIPRRAAGRPLLHPARADGLRGSTAQSFAFHGCRWPRASAMGPCARSRTRTASSGARRSSSRRLIATSACSTPAAHAQARNPAVRGLRTQHRGRILLTRSVREWKKAARPPRPPPRGALSCCWLNDATRLRRCQQPARELARRTHAGRRGLGHQHSTGW